MVQWWKHLTNILGIINYSCALFSLIRAHCYLTTLIYSVMCHTWRQKYTEGAPASILSIFWLFFPLVFFCGCGGMERRSNVYPRGAEYLRMFAEPMEVSLQKVHFHK